MGCIVIYAMFVRIGVWRKLETLTTTGLMPTLNHNILHVTEPRYGSSYSPSDGAHTFVMMHSFSLGLFVSYLRSINWQIICADKLVLLT